MEDTESCSSRASEFSPSPSRKRRLMVEVYHEVLQRLQESDFQEVTHPDFKDELWHHFSRLPLRYALDVNTEKAQDVLIHKRLLELAHEEKRPAFDVRLVQVHPCDGNEDYSDSISADRSEKENHRLHPPPTFNLSNKSENLQDKKVILQRVNSSVSGKSPNSRKAFHEVIISTTDKPKLLSQLTSLLSEVGLNIQEAHAFSTSDGYSLDVFVVYGWEDEKTDELRSLLEKKIPKIQGSTLDQEMFPPRMRLGSNRFDFLREQVNIPTDGSDVWEIDVKLVKFEQRIAAGSIGELYKGTYHSQDVAVKVLQAENLKEKVRKEFAQEVYILRRVRHKNVVQFIGACTRPPLLCIVTEYMRGGSIYNYLRQQKSVLKLPTVLKIANDVSRGMNYLHKNNIIHRDLKAANLLMDENDVVKVADFGVARVQVQSGVMTAETGTYRWMAPEVIEHKPYSHKADVYSFGIVLWELLTGKIPYDQLTPLQAAVGVVQKGLRPTIPNQTHPLMVELLERCWQQDPALRPEFSEIIDFFQHLAKRVVQEEKANKRRSVGEPYQVAAAAPVPVKREEGEKTT